MNAKLIDYPLDESEIWMSTARIVMTDNLSGVLSYALALGGDREANDDVLPWSPRFNLTAKHGFIVTTHYYNFIRALRDSL